MKKLIIIFLIVAGSHNQLRAQFTESGHKDFYLAGESVDLCFQSPTLKYGQQIVLTVLHNMGIEAIRGNVKNQRVCFHIPELITQKAGQISYKAYHDEKQLLNGALEVIPNRTTQATLEAYCGPKHLAAGHGQFTMITATVLDSMDNPYPSNTPIKYTYGSSNSTISKTTKSKSLYSYEQFVSPKKQGYGRVSAAYKEARTQEFRLDFYAHSPLKFSILVDREHEFADANQLIELSTTKITDENNNILGDGTEVLFIIKADDKVVAQAIGHCINGSATTILPAPEKAVTWEVIAQIPYLSQSQAISIDFKASINDYNVKKDASKITIGPVTGHMNQLVADGISVRLMLTKGSETYEYSTSLVNGQTSFLYKNLGMVGGTYNGRIEIAGITKKIKNIQLP